MDESLQDCVNMLKGNDDMVRNNAELALLNICHSVLTYPSNKEYRRVFLSDPVVLEKLLPATGAIECLLDVGFVEGTDCFFLPHNASLKRIQELRDTLQQSIDYAKPNSSNIVDKEVLSMTETTNEKDFFSRIIRQNQLVMLYEQPALQEKARSVIPLIDIEIATMARMRKIQKYIKLNRENAENSSEEKCKDNDINARDMLLAELMHWFKNKFFKWVDSPMCPECNCESAYESTKTSSDPKYSSIEYHRCNQCNQLVKFPRYTDPEVLLRLRRGRCGEWANVFTLLCRSLGYDTRLIWDETDHAWTEVWSVAEKRWIHLDSCEEVMDRPLLYEKGWHKKLTYVIAYSRDEVQDVTWRYTRDYEAVMSRRKLCTEENLLRLLELLNNRRQTMTNCSSVRRREIMKRRALELVGFLCIPNQQGQEDNDAYEGRSSGSHAWKLARGEITETNSSSYSWDVSRYGRSFNLSYCVVSDVYSVRTDTDSKLEEKVSWQEGAHMVEGGIFRKVEDDWKTAYLARSPGNDSGTLKWSFDVKDAKLRVCSFKLRTKDKVFHGGRTSWKLDGYFPGRERPESLQINDCGNYSTEGLKGSNRLVLTVVVSHGSGDSAWQHAQLFRQSLEDESDSMTINITLIEAESAT